ncbi:MAG: VanZ family protein [Candidatus Omnitrophota bacterium]
MKRSTAVALSWVTAGCYASFIFALSSIPSRSFPQTVSGLDKIAHLLEYIPLGLLLMRAQAFITPPRRRIQALLVTVFVIMLYALSDEFHQTFVPGRTADIKDWAMDVLGGLIGGLLFRWRE